MLFYLIVFLVLSLILCFGVLNKLLKTTNWWKNIFVFTKQFELGDKKTGMLKICNVGSNPARFAFHYDDIAGENWSTGTQGLNYDLEILRSNHNQLCKEAIVLLPIVPFSSVSGYLNNFKKPNTYLAKYTKAISPDIIQTLPQFKSVKLFLKYPLCDIRTLRYIVRDVKADTRLLITENSLPYVQMDFDAHGWITCWKEEFNISSLEDPLPDGLKNGRLISIEMMNNLVAFAKEYGYRPILVSPPMSVALTNLFSDTAKDTYIYSFVREIQSKYDIDYLDYLGDEEFSKHEYYFNALFMNLRGRKLFTKRVLQDLGLS